MKLDEKFLERVTGEAVQKHIERAIKWKVKSIIDDLLAELFGGRMYRRKAKPGAGKKLPELKEYLRNALMCSTQDWMHERLSEETGGDLVSYVINRINADELDDEDEEEGEDEE